MTKFGEEMSLFRNLSGALANDPAHARFYLEQTIQAFGEDPAIRETIEAIKAKLPGDNREITLDDLRKVAEALKREAKLASGNRTLHLAADGLEYSVRE